MRWETYRREQKARHKVCMEIKGNRRPKRNDVVVAYGSAQFERMKKGQCKEQASPPPAKKLLNQLQQ